MKDALRDLASGRQRPFPRAPRDLREGLAAVVFLVALGVGYGIWHERHEGPRHVRNVQAALREAGYPHADLRRDWINTCSRGGKGYVWTSRAAKGAACSYGDLPRASIEVWR